MITYRRNRSTIRSLLQCMCVCVVRSHWRFQRGRLTKKQYRPETKGCNHLQPIKTCLLHKSEVRQIRLRFVKFVRSSLSSSEVCQKFVRDASSSSEVRQKFVKFVSDSHLGPPTRPPTLFDELLTNSKILKNFCPPNFKENKLPNFWRTWRISDPGLRRIWRTSDELLTNFLRTSYELDELLTNLWRTFDELLTNLTNLWDLKRNLWWFFKKLQKTSS